VFQVFNGCEDAEHTAHHIAPRKWKRQTKGAKLDIRQATASYETWLRGCTTVVDAALRSKHEQMRSDPFLFFRGTYYRWTQLFPQACKELAHAPSFLCSGDLHVGSFGTWRDREGRLCWGVDDFDDAYPLAYTNDLARLVASLKMVIDAEGAISANVAFSASDNNNLPLIWALRIRFSAARYSFLRRSSWSTVPVM